MALPKPIITWHIKKPLDQEYTINENFYAGSYTKDNKLNIEFLLWNNYKGNTLVEDLKAFRITACFDTLEDSGLLKYITLHLDGNVISGTINGNVMTFPLPANLTLSGDPNDGSLDYQNNFISLKLEFAVPNNYTLKSNDLKTISLDVISE